jgi:UDP-N-acetylglucosamine 2-epimerase (non-hydrolysing)
MFGINNLIISVVGARPNFMKVSPIIESLNMLKMKNIMVHTGQHYDEKLSGSFFKKLELKDPEIFLGIGSGSHGEQTSKIILEFEKVCIKHKPSLIILVGDVNSTLACAISAVKLHIPIAHVESGLRSFDMKMPEEINRILVDRISDYLFVTEKSGIQNLKKEGVSKDKIYFVGNCMIDSLIKILPYAVDKKPWETYGLEKRNYILVTFHRPSNVDNSNNLNKVVKLINDLSKMYDIIFPMHPRTYNSVKNLNIKFSDKVKIVDPLPYDTFLGLMSESKLVITDSGGIQEETTYLGIKCLTIRDNTERPVTVDKGTNRLVNLHDPKLFEKVDDLIKSDYSVNAEIPELWDGKAGSRIAKILYEKFPQ